MARLARGERGSGLFGLLVILVVLAVIIFVGFKFLMLHVHYRSMLDVVKNRARFAVSYSDEAIARDIIHKGWENGIAVQKDSIYIYREPGYSISIQVPYSDTVDLMVKQFYFHFLVEESAPLPR
jgi:hypothetical protein